MTLKVRVKMLVSGALLVVAGGVYAAPASPVPELDLTGELPALAAMYTTRHWHETGATKPSVKAPGTEWRLFRESTRVEIEDPVSQTGELWQLDGNTQFLWKLFHADRRGVEYRSDDFRVLDMESPWQQHALLLAPAMIQKLTLVEAGWRDGYPFRHLRGDVDGEKLEVIWRPDLNLPAMIRRSRGGEVDLIELQAAYPLAQAPWSRHDHTDYDIIDYADLGDRESDPFVARVQNQLPGGMLHTH